MLHNNSYVNFEIKSKSKKRCYPYLLYVTHSAVHIPTLSLLEVSICVLISLSRASLTATLVTARIASWGGTTVSVL